MAVPPTWRKCLPWKSKLLHLSTFSSSLIRCVFEGLVAPPLIPSRPARAAVQPSLFGILVYRLATSSVTRIQSGGSCPNDSNIKRKYVVSLMYDLIFMTLGCKKWSINWEILSVGQPFLETRGLPGRSSFLLCTLGKV